MYEVELEMEESEFLSLALMAHDRDITLNQMVIYILEKHIERCGTIGQVRIDSDES